MKRMVFIVSAVFIALSLGSCFTGWTGDEGSITISIGGGDGRAAAWPPTNKNGALPLLEHKITIYGPAGQEYSRTIKAGETSTTFSSVAAGTWKVNVEATCMEIPFGSGNESVDVKAGKSTPVSVPMKPSDTTFFLVANDEEWGEAVSAINKAGKYCIILTEDINVFGSADYTFGEDIKSAVNPIKNITVTSVGKNKTLTLQEGGSLLRIGANQTVIVQDVKLAGMGEENPNTASLVTVTGGTFTMKGSASVTGNFFFMSGDNKETIASGGGVYIADGGKFTMNDYASVYENSVKVQDSSGNNNGSCANGGGVYVSGNNSTFTMNGNASVSGNFALGSGNVTFTYGGGVHIAGGSTFTMNGNASVSGNFAKDGSSNNFGGGVYIGDGSAFNMYGGTIENNEAPFSGGGVYIETGEFTMHGGEIYNNTTGSGGGVQVNGPTATFTMKGGTVVGENEYRGLAPNIAINATNNGAALHVKNGTATYGKYNTSFRPVETPGAYSINKTITGAGVSQ
ncbi:MAG: hypothetical protein LBH44_09315 [Treponema sp.]|jgi:hypothetical protein|nr:hypothetical protein [Treponema sp.]